MEYIMTASNSNSNYIYCKHTNCEPTICPLRLHCGYCQVLNRPCPMIYLNEPNIVWTTNTCQEVKLYE